MAYYISSLQVGSFVNAHTRMRDKSILDVSVATRVLTVPIEGDSKTILPGHLLLPAKFVQTSRVDVVAQVIECSIFDERHQLIFSIFEASQLDQGSGHFNVRLLVGAANVVDQSNFSLEKNDLERSRNVFHVQKVAGVLASTVQCDGTTAKQLIDELRDQLLRVLMRAVHVVSAGDDNGHAKGAVIRLRQELGTGFRRCIRVGGLKNLKVQTNVRTRFPAELQRKEENGYVTYLFLVHRLLISTLLSVDFVGGNVNESLDSGSLRRLQQNVSSHDVVLGELERISERVVNMGLRREVHDGVDLFRLQNEIDQVGAANVSLHKLVVGQVLDAVKILQA